VTVKTYVGTPQVQRKVRGKLRRPKKFGVLEDDSEKRVVCKQFWTTMS
jgi:hypothetical protein